MHINELVYRLDEIKAEHGDVEVFVAVDLNRTPVGGGVINGDNLVVEYFGDDGSVYITGTH